MRMINNFEYRSRVSDVSVDIDGHSETEFCELSDSQLNRKVRESTEAMLAVFEGGATK